MKVQVRYLNPAGNITAVVLSSVLPELRPALSRAIMAQGRAEQVGFAATPRLGGDCRVEMMGSERMARETIGWRWKFPGQRLRCRLR